MPQKAKGTRQTTVTETSERGTDAAEAARATYEETARTGRRIAEQSQEWWTRMMTQGTSATEWQKQFTNFTSLAGGMFPLAQNRMEDMIDWATQNNRTGAELVRKAMEAAQTPAIGESQRKWMDFWTSSMEAVQSNIETATEISNKAIDGWVRFVRDHTQAGQAPTLKAA